MIFEPFRCCFQNFSQTSFPLYMGVAPGIQIYMISITVTVHTSAIFNKLTSTVIQSCFCLYCPWLYSLFYQVKLSSTKINLAVLRVNTYTSVSDGMFDLSHSPFQVTISNNLQVQQLLVDPPKT